MNDRSKEEMNSYVVWESYKIRRVILCSCVTSRMHTMKEKDTTQILFNNSMNTLVLDSNLLIYVVKWRTSREPMLLQ